jgi:L-threonylcarbamoyladenylate synthase
MRPPLPEHTPILSADDPAALDHAAEILAQGGCVGLPTETVYGLAADASDGEAVAGIYEAKGRPRFNPLIAHVDSLERARTLVDLPEKAMRLAESIWPGPLTLVARKRPGAPVSDLATAGLETLAVRLPASPALRALVTRLDRPFAAPSANPSGQVSPTQAQHVKAGLNGRIHLILDGGACPVGVESTIISFVDPDNPSLLRPGGASRSLIESVTGPLGSAQHDSAKPSAPGQLASHYAPQAEVRLNATSIGPDEAYLAFGAHEKIDGTDFFNLSAAGDLAEAAANLFSGLRMLDAPGRRIAVAPIPDEGLGEAINDRLRRAAVR